MSQAKYATPTKLPGQSGYRSSLSPLSPLPPLEHPSSTKFAPSAFRMYLSPTAVENRARPKPTGFASSTQIIGTPTSSDRNKNMNHLRVHLPSSEEPHNKFRGPNSPLSPLPPLEHPSAHSFAPASLKKIIGPSSNGAKRAYQTAPSYGAVFVPAQATPFEPAMYTTPSGTLRVRIPEELKEFWAAQQTTPKRSDGGRPRKPRRTVSEILERVNLPHLVQLFEDEEIDLMVLATLDKDDLTEMGVRKRDQPIVLAAIQKYT